MKKQLLILSTELRSVLRRVGILPYLSRIRGFAHKIYGKTDYEHAFDDAMFAEIKPGDIVWDIGANVGLYSKKFSEVVGAEGLVVCVEPSQACFSKLEATVSELDNVICVKAAMADQPGELELHVEDNSLGVSHTLVQDVQKMSARQTETVKVMTGEVLLQQEGVKSPNVIKVDVEGFEEEVLIGLKSVINTSSCRALFCEIHFTMLEAKGAKHAPAQITESLEQQGFKVTWTDASHITAKRI